MPDKHQRAQSDNLNRKVCVCLIGYGSQNLSGVGTFTNSFVRHFSGFDGFRYMTLPRDASQVSTVMQGGGGTRRNGRYRPRGTAGGLFLGAGYLRQVLSEYRLLRQQGVTSRIGLILINQFGCETLPIAVRLAAPRARVVAIAHTHPGSSAAANHPLRRVVEWLCARVCQEVIFNSRANAGLWCKRPAGQSYRKRVIHYGLPDPGKCGGAEEDPGSVGFQPMEGFLNVISISRMVRWKGHRELIEGWRRLPPDSPVRLTIIGDGPERAACEDVVRAAGMMDRIRFVGAMPDGSRSLRWADIAIHTPIEAEAFGLVVLEAMSRGVPVIASRVGGIPEFVDRDCGILIDPFDAQDIANALMRLVTDADLRGRLGAAGRARFLKAFTEEVMFAKYENLLAPYWKFHDP